MMGMTFKELYEWAVANGVENEELIIDYSPEYEWVIAENELQITEYGVCVTLDYEED